jgi:hypothetical protein
MGASATKEVIRTGRTDPWTRSPEQAAEYEAAAAALNQEARDRWNDESFHREVAADIAETVDYSFRFTNLFGDYVRVQDVGEFERFILRERRGLKVFWTSRGGEIEESQLKTESWELPRDTLGFHVSEHEDKLRANFSESLEDLTGLAEERMDAEQWRRLLSLLQAGIPTGAPNYVPVNGLSKEVVVDSLREVRDAIKPDGVSNVPVTILGRAAMVDKISDFELGFDPEATAEIRAKGRLGVFRGATVQQLFNYTDEVGASYVPANELWIFGGNVGRFARYGGMQVRPWRENSAWYSHYMGRKDMGGLLHHPEQAVRIVDSTITP